MTRSGLLALLLFAGLPHGAFVRQSSESAAFAAAGAFFALSVEDLDASVTWYREKFGLRLVMQPTRSGEARVAALEGNGLIVELIQHDGARPLRAVAPSVPGNLSVHGFVKAGLIVESFDEALATLRSRGVETAVGPFPRTATQRANFIVRDNAGNLIQFFGR